MEEKYVTITGHYSKRLFTIKVSSEVINFLDWLKDIEVTNEGFDFKTFDEFEFDEEF